MGWFGQPGHTCEKKVWGRLWATFEARFFMFSWAKKNLKFFWKFFSVCTEKLHRIRVKNVRKHFGMYFYRGKNSFFRAKNFNVSTKTLWSVLCWLLLWPQPKKYGLLKYFTFTALPAWLLTVEIKAFPQTNSSHSR